MANLSLKNRFFMAPMATIFTMDQLTDFLAARARGGAALITTSQINVHPGGRMGHTGELRLEKDKDIKTFIPLVKTVQSAGAGIAAQLNHTSRYSPGTINL